MPCKIRNCQIKFHIHHNWSPIITLNYNMRAGLWFGECVDVDVALFNLYYSPWSHGAMTHTSTVLLGKRIINNKWKKLLLKLNSSLCSDVW